MSSTEQYQPPPNGFRTFVIAWVTQSISVIGNQLTWFAITVWLTQVLFAKPEQKPQLAFALTIIGLTYAITLLVTPFAGAWADRHDRKRTMIRSSSSAETRQGISGHNREICVQSGRAGKAYLSEDWNIKD